MPAPPILGDIARKVRADEVFLYAYAQYLRNTDGDIYAAGEVGVELGRVQNRADENIRAGVRLRVAAQSCHGDKQPVGNDKLFEIAPQYALKAEGYLLKIRLMPGKKRVLEIAEARNGALNEQRKERGKQRDAQYVPLRLDLLPVHVDDVADGLEGVERYAERQHPVDRGNAGRKDRIYVIYKEVCVLERGKYADIGNKREHKYQLAALFALLFIRLAPGPLERPALG